MTLNSRTGWLRVLGEGSLIFQATAVLPLWSELSLKTDSAYPLARNVLLIIGFVSIPYIICLLLSHALYRKTHTRAPDVCCGLSLALLMATVFLWHVATTSGEKGIIVFPLIVLQSLVAMVAFGFLRYRFA
jgi:hypothetical protein